MATDSTSAASPNKDFLNRTYEDLLKQRNTRTDTKGELTPLPMGGAVHDAAYDKYMAAKNQESIDNKNLKAYTKTQDQILKAQGYSLKASPYDFDPTQFQNSNLVQQLADIKSGQANTAGQVAGMAIPQQEFRGAQSALIGQLANQAAGQGPSVVQAQYQKALDQGLAANKASAMSANVNPAMAARMNAQGVETSALTAANASAQLKSQEQLNAQTQLAAVANQARTLDLTLASNQQQYLNDMTKYYMSLGMDQQNAQMNANIKLQEDMSASHQQAQETLSKQPQKPGVLGTVIGAVAGAGAAIAKSDKNLKENIKGISNFLDKLVAKEYDMKPEAGGAKNVVGVLAQDVEKSKLGKTVIEPLPDGHKGLDVHRSLSLALAGLANINGRLKKLEA